MSFNKVKPNIDDMEKNRDVEGLISALTFRDCITRKEAAVALKRIGDPRALFPLIDALKYQNWHDKYAVMDSVRENAAEALGVLRDKKGVDSLIEALEDKDEEVRWKAAWALGNIGDERAVEPLINALYDERWSVRRYAAASLGRIKDKRSVVDLINALNDKEWQVRRYAAEALGKIGDERAIEPLVSCLKDNDGDVRWKAIRSLGKMKEAAIEPLIVIFGSEDWRIRTRVAEALGDIGDKRAVNILINALVGKNKDSNRFVRGRVAEALGKIGDGRAVEPLIEARKDSYKYARIKAEEALERISGNYFSPYDDGEISFNYPNSWKIKSIHDEKKLVKGTSANGEISFFINKNKDLSDISLREFVDIIEDALSIQNNQIISETEYEVDGIDIYKIIGESIDFSSPLKVVIVALKTEEVLYYLRFTGKEDKFEESEDEINLIIDSFRMNY